MMGVIAFLFFYDKILIYQILKQMTHDMLKFKIPTNIRLSQFIAMK